MIHRLEEFCFFSTMGIVPGEQGELSNRRLQVGSAQGKTPDTQASLDGSIKQPQSCPVENTVQVKFRTSSRKTLPGPDLGTVGIHDSKGQLPGATILETQPPAQCFNQSVEITQ
jgi:hypothetical protein